MDDGQTARLICVRLKHLRSDFLLMGVGSGFHVLFLPVSIEAFPVITHSLEIPKYRKTPYDFKLAGPKLDLWPPSPKKLLEMPI